MRPELSELVWRKSSFSGGNGQCVEVAEVSGGGRFVRDTKDRSRPAHFFTDAEWRAFVQGVKAGEFD